MGELGRAEKGDSGSIIRASSRGREGERERDSQTTNERRESARCGRKTLRCGLLHRSIMRASTTLGGRAGMPSFSASQTSSSSSVRDRVCWVVEKLCSSGQKSAGSCSFAHVDRPLHMGYLLHIMTNTRVIVYWFILEHCFLY